MSFGHKECGVVYTSLRLHTKYTSFFSVRKQAPGVVNSVKK